MMKRDLVSVIVPAFNAWDTLHDTLVSVRRQTYSQLEIIVVNDGSTDRTEAVVHWHASRDARVKLVNTSNQGVAAARNRGIASASGDLLAPIDADDLWHPEKIERQLGVFRRSEPRLGYVYTCSRLVDTRNGARKRFTLTHCEGHVFLRSIFTNFVGNGSSLLIRRKALEEIGGYSTELRSRGLEGSEDRLAQSLMARQWLVGVVPACLTGYRKRPGAMSADPVHMLRSQVCAMEIVARLHPDVPEWLLNATRAKLEIRLATRLIRKTFMKEGVTNLWSATRHAPMVAAAECMSDGVRHPSRLIQRVVRSRKKSRQAPFGADFYLHNPDAEAVPHIDERSFPFLLKRIEAEERRFAKAEALLHV